MKSSTTSRPWRSAPAVRRGTRRLAATAPPARHIGRNGWRRCCWLGHTPTAASSDLRMHQPADAPAGHRPGLGEAVDHEHRVVRFGDGQERRRMRRAVIDQGAIDFVADDGDAALAREIQDAFLFVRRQHPAGGIAGRGEEHRLGARVAGVEQFVEIQMPAAARSSPRPAAPAAAPRRRLGGLEDVGPDRRDDHDIVAGLAHASAGRVTTASMAAPGTVMRSSAISAPGGALVEIAASLRAGAGCRAHWCRRSCRPPAPAVAASRMKGGVTRSVSPNHRGRMSGLPSPSAVTWLMPEGPGRG